jgi:hypothetical protein
MGLGSGISNPGKPYSGSRGQKGTGSRIRNTAYYRTRYLRILWTRTEKTDKFSASILIYLSILSYQHEEEKTVLIHNSHHHHHNTSWPPAYNSNMMATAPPPQLYQNVTQQQPPMGPPPAYEKQRLYPAL